jgi:hypothetical protein
MSAVVSSHQLSADDAPKIAAAISQLAKIGLKPLFPEREFPEVVRQKVEELEGIWIPDPPLPLTWVALALAGSEQVFANAIHYEDHCFDGAGDEEYAEVVASIMALAGEDWPGHGATVAATRVVSEGRSGRSDRMEITIHQQGGCAPFELTAEKDFDWSVVTRLNERLPSGARGRFAAFFDGNATIVYLRPDQLKELGKLFGYDFVSEIDPLPERPPLSSHRAVQNPLPVWALVISFLAGTFAASQLIAMILGGAPYTFPGRNLTPISLASAPLEFAFAVALHIAGVGLFLGVPLFLIVMRWRARRRVQGNSS